jgi:hypothetical protein
LTFPCFQILNSTLAAERNIAIIKIGLFFLKTIITDFLIEICSADFRACYVHKIHVDDGLQMGHIVWFCEMVRSDETAVGIDNRHSYASHSPVARGATLVVEKNVFLWHSILGEYIMRVVLQMTKTIKSKKKGQPTLHT